MKEGKLKFHSCPMGEKKPIWNFALFHSVDEIKKEDWNAVLKDSNLYLSLNYLEGVEKSLSHKMKFCYSITYDEKEVPVLIQSFQIVQFEDKRRNHTNTFLNHLKGRFRNNNGYTTDILVCGNVFSDGENGLVWCKDANQEYLMKSASEVAKKVAKSNGHGIKISLILFKEFWPKSIHVSKFLSDSGYQEFCIDVNMVLKIHSQWTSMDDYLGSMKTKYRTRAKSVFKKSKDIEIKSLDQDEILENKDRIQELFNNVQEKSEFQMGTILSESFAKCKDMLGSKFLLKGAFYQGELIGFSTSFVNGDNLEANYVGMDYQHNKNFAVYQYLLYDLVKESITLNLKELQLGRTSELVKSSLGAQPVNMKLYGKHKSKITNIVVKAILRKISPAKFELRKPFKENFEKLWTH
jgi:predicted N-acyltransferase